MSFFNKVSAFFGFAGLLMPTVRETQALRQHHRTNDSKKLSDHAKLEKFYSTKLKKFPVIREFHGDPVFSTSGKPLSLYALNETNYKRKLRMFWNNTQSIPTFS